MEPYVQCQAQNKYPQKSSFICNDTIPDGHVLISCYSLLRCNQTSREDPLGEEMATHSSILAWEMPWTEEPGRLQSMRPQSWTWLSTHTQRHNQTNDAKKLRRRRTLMPCE